MNDILINIVIALLIGLLGFFLRDVYNYLKRKFIKSKKPKVVLEYSITPKGSHGSNPRIYEFYSNLLVQNIDTKPIYNLIISQIVNGKSSVVFEEYYLKPNEKKEIKNELEVPFEESKRDYEAAKQVISEEFKTPNYILKFEDKNGHKYTQKVVIK